MVDCLGDGGGGVRGEGGGRRRRRGGRREEGGEGSVDYRCPFGLCEGGHCCQLWMIVEATCGVGG